MAAVAWHTSTCIKVTGKPQIAKFEEFLVAAVTEMRTDPDSWNEKWFDTPRKLRRANERSYVKRPVAGSGGR